MSDAFINHPTADELRALSLGQLEEAELTRISTHLRDCPECCRRIDQPAADDPLLSRLQTAARPEAMLVTPVQRRSAVRALRNGQDDKTAARHREPETGPVIHRTPKQVENYEILAEIGRGGMGVVYKARHRGLQRLAAPDRWPAGSWE